MGRTAAFLLLTWVALDSIAAAPSARSLCKQARKAEQAGDLARAYLLYSEAAALDPGNARYWQRGQSARTRAALQGKLALNHAAGNEVSGQAASAEPLEPATETDWLETRKPQPPKELKAAPGSKSIDLRANAKTLFEDVGRTYGLDCVFDGDYQPGPVMRFRMEEADYRQALHALEAATGSFIIPLSERLFLVAKDTPQKRLEMEPAVSVAIPIPHPVSVQEVQELAQAVRQIADVPRLSVDSQRRMVVIRDRVSKVRPAEAIFRDLLHYRPEIMVELQILEVSRTAMTSFGLDLTTSFPIIYLGTLLHNAPSIPSGITRLAVFGGGKTLFGVGTLSATVFARMSRSNAQSLLATQVRSSDGQPASFHVGDRYPILTSGYFGPIPSDATQVYRPPPSFNFEDLGLSVKLTPHVNGEQEVTLDIDTEFKLLAGQAFNGVPVISNRKISGEVRLRHGEWGFVAGMMSLSEARNISGLAGLASVPLLGPLVRHNEAERDSSEILIVMKPHLLSVPPGSEVTHTLRVGSETRPLTPL